MEILKGVSFSFPKKGLFAVYGPSGSGKSTLLAVLSGYLRAKSGKVIEDGKDLLRLSRRGRERRLRTRVGIIRQGFDLLEGKSVFYNAALPLFLLGWGKRKALEAVRPLLEKEGLLPSLEKKAGLLSGGEKARLALVRALVKDPETILADEPTGNLDGNNAALAMSLLKECSKERLVILVSHDEQLSRPYVDGHIRLYDGVVVEADLPVDTSKEVRKMKGKRWNFRPSRLRDFLLEEFWKGKGKMALSSAASCLSALLFVFSAAFEEGAEISIKEESRLSLSYLSFSYSIVEAIEGNGPVSLTRSRRPSKEEEEELLLLEEDVQVVPSLSYYLPSRYPVEVNGFPFDEVELVPIGSFSYLNDPIWSGRVIGEIPTGNPLSYCVVNKEFASLVKGIPQGAKVMIEREIHLEEGDLTEDFSLGLEFFIAATIDEFSFLSTPRLYYSYAALAGYLKNVEFKTMAGNPYSHVEESSDASPVSSYSSLVFAESPEGAEELYAESKALEGHSLTSEAMASAESFAELSSSFILLIEPFFLILLLGTGFVMASLAYSSFLSRKRDFAILSSLGARHGDLLALYLIPVFLSSLLGALLALCPASFYLSLGRSYFLEATKMPLLAPELPLTSIIFGLLIFAILPLVGLIVPYFRGSFRNLHEELNRE